MSQGLAISARLSMRMEARQSFRVQDNLPVSWQWKESGLAGQGFVRNLSNGGMMVVTKNDGVLDKNTLLEFQSLLNNEAIPSLGRVVWSKPAGLFRRRARYGIEFVDPSLDVIVRVNNRIQAKAVHKAGAQKIIDSVGWVFLIVMVMLATGVLVIQVSNYNNLVITSRMLLDSSSKQSLLYRSNNGEYWSLKDMYAQTAQDLEATQNMLAQITTQNHQLTSEMKAVKARLKSENQKLSQQLKLVRSRLDLYEGNYRTLAEAREAMNLNQNSFRAIKNRLQILRREARLARIAAQQERDRILLAQGNQGWVIKEGKVFQSPQDSAPMPGTSSYKIDVEILNTTTK